MYGEAPAVDHPLITAQKATRRFLQTELSFIENRIGTSRERLSERAPLVFGRTAMSLQLKISPPKWVDDQRNRTTRPWIP